MMADGSNGSVELLDGKIIIRRKGLMNVLTQGVQGDKSVPFDTITAVQFRPAGRFMAGMIQFTLVGGREFRGGMMEATKDENAVLFTREQQSNFEVIRDQIDTVLSTRSSARSDPATGADELEKLANLVERGFLTRDEFEQKKRDLLSR